MFCPKCGTNLPDDASFCGSCGSKIEGKGQAAQAQTPQTATAQKLSGLKVNGAGIAAVVIAVVAVLFSIMPWLDISSQILGITGVASGLASGASALLGTQSPTIDLQDSYSVWDLPSMASAFESYVQTYGYFLGSQVSGAVGVVTGFSWLCLILWLFAILLTIRGTMSAFKKGSMGALRAGSAVMAATVVAFYVLAGALGSDIGSANALPAICLILSIVALCCSFAARGRA